MRILVVEDSIEKSNNIKNLLINKCGIRGEEITITNDISSAEKRLKEKKYNLLVLDLKLPNEIGEDELDDGGIQLIEDIKKNHRLIAPEHIIILSAHKRIMNENKERIRSLHFESIFYKNASIEWKTSLKEKVSYIVRADQNTYEQNDGYNYDIAIVTSQDKEREAVKTLGEWKIVPVNHDSARCWECVWEMGGKAYKVVTTMLPDMGMVAAATYTSKMIHSFKPRFMVMVGIAGGIDKDDEYGDIIMPSQVRDYSSGKYSVPKDKREEALANPLDYFEPTLPTLHTNTEIFNISLEGYTDVLAGIRQEWEQYGPKEYWKEISNLKYPSIRHGDLVTGVSVIQNQSIISQMITNHMRKAKGIDMEAYGLHYACEHSPKPKPIPLVIKGISDFADEDKSDTFQHYAAFISARFAKYFILNKVIPELESLS